MIAFSKYKNGIRSYREKAIKHYGAICEICGYDEFVDILDVHHIDKNRQHNTLINLIVLCPMCHALITRKLAILINRKLVWGFSSEGELLACNERRRFRFPQPPQ